MNQAKNKWSRVLMVCGASVAALGGVSAAHAQNADNDVLRRTQMQLRQSEQERNSLRGELARLQAQLDAQRAEVDRIRQTSQQKSASKDDGAAVELALKNSKLNQANQSLKDTREELEQLRATTTRQAQAVQNVQSMLQNAQSSLALRDELVGLCRSRNEEMYKVGQELIGMYRDKDFNSFTKREPVLQIQQVKLQNLMQDFADRLRDQRVYEDTLPPSLEKKMQESLQKDAAAQPAKSNAGGSPQS